MWMTIPAARLAVRSVGMGTRFISYGSNISEKSSVTHLHSTPGKRGHSHWGFWEFLDGSVSRFSRLATSMGAELGKMLSMSISSLMAAGFVFLERINT